jgi:hypothetical protein
VDGEKSLSECYRRVFEDSASLVVERAVTILTKIRVKHSVAAVPNHRPGIAAWEIDAVIPANLYQQVRGPMLQDECLD